MHWHWPLTQTEGEEHIPQLEVTSQSSVKLPQVRPSVAHVVDCAVRRQPGRQPPESRRPSLRPSGAS